MNSKTILNSNRLPGRGSNRLVRGSSVSEHWSPFPCYLPHPRPLNKHFNFGGQQSWREKAVEGSIIQHFNTRLLLVRMKYQRHSDVAQLQFQDFLKLVIYLNWWKVVRRSVTQQWSSCQLLPHWRPKMENFGHWCGFVTIFHLHHYISRSNSTFSLFPLVWTILSDNNF